MKSDEHRSYFSLIGTAEDLFDCTGFTCSFSWIDIGCLASIAIYMGITTRITSNTFQCIRSNHFIVNHLFIIALPMGSTFISIQIDLN